MNWGQFYQWGSSQGQTKKQKSKVGNKDWQRYYLLKRGDSPVSVARKFGVDVRKTVKKNRGMREWRPGSVVELPPLEYDLRSLGRGIRQAGEFVGGVFRNEASRYQSQYNTAARRGNYTYQSRFNLQQPGPQPPTLFQQLSNAVRTWQPQQATPTDPNAWMHPFGSPQPNYPSEARYQQQYASPATKRPLRAGVGEERYIGKTIQPNRLGGYFEDVAPGVPSTENYHGMYGGQTGASPYNYASRVAHEYAPEQTPFDQQRVRLAEASRYTGLALYWAGDNPALRPNWISADVQAQLGMGYDQMVALGYEWDGVRWVRRDPPEEEGGGGGGYYGGGGGGGGGGGWGYGGGGGGGGWGSEGGTSGNYMRGQAQNVFAPEGLGYVFWRI